MSLESGERDFNGPAVSVDFLGEGGLYNVEIWYPEGGDVLSADNPQLYIKRVMADGSVTSDIVSISQEELEAALDAQTRDAASDNPDSDSLRLLIEDFPKFKRFADDNRG